MNSASQKKKRVLVILSGAKDLIPHNASCKFGNPFPNLLP
jgi:hypothetical protein